MVFRFLVHFPVDPFDPSFFLIFFFCFLLVEADWNLTILTMVEHLLESHPLSTTLIYYLLGNFALQSMEAIARVSRKMTKEIKRGLRLFFLPLFWLFQAHTVFSRGNVVYSKVHTISVSECRYCVGGAGGEAFRGQERYPVFRGLLCHPVQLAAGQRTSPHSDSRTDCPGEVCDDE